MNPVIVISDRDNVATALETLEAGLTIQLGDTAITVLESVPRGHKLAIREVRAGEPVVKYGSAIGLASSVILPGAHVHVHNVESTRGRGDRIRQTPSDQGRIAEPPDDQREPEDAGSRPT